MKRCTYIILPLFHLLEVINEWDLLKILIIQGGEK